MLFWGILRLIKLLRHRAQKGAEQQMEHIYDMIIIGGGPGGYTAALYAARAGLDAVVLEGNCVGGQMAQAHWIENYPGFEDGIEGFSLAEKMRKGAERFGAETLLTEALSVDLTAEPKVVETGEGALFGKTVVIATGAGPQKLGVNGEKQMLGRGVSYCAACDGMLYKDKTVVIVGGGNSAASDALQLSRVAKKVILVHRRDSLRATKVYQEQLLTARNVELRWNSTVSALIYGESVTGVRLKNAATGQETELACDGVFVSIGRKPESELVENQLELDERGYVAAGENTKTSLPGVFAVGDVRTKQLRQVVTAVADGAAAVHEAEVFLSSGREIK